jgi:cob(I)alamin adenosyltransferase
MKIYTRTGDDGTTGLVGGKRIAKSDLRMQAIGDIDELNAAIGLCRVATADISLAAELGRIQNWLFDIGGELASPEEGRLAVRRLGSGPSEVLEQSIDRMTDELPPLRNFILPGGSEGAARLHLARTICRRAERRVLELCEKASIRDVILVFLNRLSDWLFIAARSANRSAGVEDVAWNSEED